MLPRNSQLLSTLPGYHHGFADDLEGVHQGGGYEAGDLRGKRPVLLVRQEIPAGAKTLPIPRSMRLPGSVNYEPVEEVDQGRRYADKADLPNGSGDEAAPESYSTARR